MSDHGGWAVLVTATASGTIVDRRRVELVSAGLPALPHHHEGQKLPIHEGVGLVVQVKASAERLAKIALEALPGPIAGIALRKCPPLPETIEERIRDYRAMCVADWVMYRRALADAATERSWAVHWYDPKQVFEGAATLVNKAGATAGRPWTKDHKLALAAAIEGARTLKGA